MLRHDGVIGPFRRPQDNSHPEPLERRFFAFTPNPTARKGRSWRSSNSSSRTPSSTACCLGVRRCASNTCAIREMDHMHILQPEEIDRLLEAATGDGPYRTLYLLAVHTGLRRGELLGLHRGDLDAHTRRLYVRRALNRLRDGDHYAIRETTLKTRYSRRMIEDLSPALIEALLALPASDDPTRPYMFLSRAGGPIDPDNVERCFT